ncbi:MAG: hypothetical protein WC471_04625 [Candidatus Woesearchaeota archaeon]
MSDGQNNNNNNQIKITYETLFELLRREKGKGELQELDRTFMRDLAAYMLEKNEMMQKENEQAHLFGEQEKLKTLNEMNNIKKIVREFHERRERKIIDMALNKSRTNSSLITNVNLLPEEVPFYESIVKVLNEYRTALNCAMSAERVKAQALKITKDDSVKMVKFIQPVARFVGKELEPYGPFQNEDVASLPSEIAEILVQQLKAKEIVEIE